MDISGISTSIQSLSNILKQAAGSSTDLTEKLLEISASNIVERNKLSTIGQFIDLYA